MKKLLLFILLIAMSVTVWGQAKIVYDKERNAEGALVMQNVFATALYIFTYGALECDHDVEVFDEADCDLNAARWFFGSDKIVDGMVRGVLYQTHGLLYPVGIQDPEDPFVQNVGTTFAVGEYRMIPAGDGWVVQVKHFAESPLEKEDPVFRTFQFVDLVFAAD